MFATPFFDVSVTNVVELLKSGECDLAFIGLKNPNTSEVWLQLFDAASASSVTLGTTTPTLSLPIPGNSSLSQQLNPPIKFRKGIAYALTTTATGNTAPTNAGTLNAAIS